VTDARAVDPHQPLHRGPFRARGQPTPHFHWRQLLGGIARRKMR
jgi:hypothetical protein